MFVLRKFDCGDSLIFGCSAVDFFLNCVAQIDQHLAKTMEALTGLLRLKSATAGKADLAAIARGAGIVNATVVRTVESFEAAARRGLNRSGHHFIVAKVEQGSVAKLPTLNIDGKEGKYRFARHIEASEGVEILRPRYTHI